MKTNINQLKEITKTVTLTALIAGIAAFAGGFYTATKIESGIRAEVTEALESVSKPAEAAQAVQAVK